MKPHPSQPQPTASSTSTQTQGSERGQETEGAEKPLKEEQEGGEEARASKAEMGSYQS